MLLITFRILGFKVICPLVRKIVSFVAQVTNLLLLQKKLLDFFLNTGKNVGLGFHYDFLIPEKPF